MNKHSYLIESLSPLVFRSGRPFGAQSASDDAIFPLPSSAAGLIRAQSVEQKEGKLQDFGKQLNHADYQALLRIESQGPFLVRFNPDENGYTILAPKPANALYFEDKATSQTLLVRLSPKAYDDALCGSDLPEGLLPVQMETRLKGKPQKGVAFWTLEHFLQWQNGTPLSFAEVKEKGANLPPLETRTHVAMNDYTHAAQSGKLFQTVSFDLGHTKEKDGAWQAERFGFLVLSEQTLHKNAVVFGGERRLSYLKPVNTNTLTQDAPSSLLEKINTAKGFSLAFLTPCIFANGYLPSWIDSQTMQGVIPNTQKKVTLKACAIDRWMPVSGWDSIIWKPKATRKAISAGSVYWFELHDELTETDLNALWGKALACHEQDKRDGFGVALPAAWTHK